MLTLLLMTPTVFFAMQRLFDWGDRAIKWLRHPVLPKKRPKD